MPHNESLQAESARGAGNGAPCPSYDWPAIRAKLAAMNGRDYWRSFEQLADTDEFQDYLKHEFPRQAGEWMDAVGRRHFLKLMAASLGLAGSMGCLRQPDEKIVPYVRQPEEIVPGKSLFFASAMTLGGYSNGILVQSQMGRPTKIEGNPEHPASLGATDAFTQAAILSLYDPDRSQTVMHRERVDTWGNFLTAITAELPAIKAKQGRGLRILTETITSPTLADQLQELGKQMPEARWHQYEPCGRDNVRAGARLAFGEYVETIYHFDRADVILSLDADFLWNMPGSVRYARDFIDRRRIVAGDDEAAAQTPAARMSRLYALEATPGLTGAMADHRLPLAPAEIEAFARALADRLGVELGSGGADVPAGVSTKWLAAVAADLQTSAGASVVIAGDGQPAVVHALAHAINARLNNVGKTVEYLEPVEARPEDQLASLKALIADIEAGQVDALVILEGNPAYNTPAALDFAGKLELAVKLKRVKLAVHLSQHYDETSFLCHWHVPAAHFLESWGDARAYNGVATIIQPLIAPLYDGRTAYEFISVLLGRADQSAFEIVRQYWQKRLHSDNFDRVWRKAVHDGVVPDTKAAGREVALSFDGREQGHDNTTLGAGSFELLFLPDASVWDGRFANNGWLQELPRPVTKLTWDNAVYISPTSAQNERLANGDLVELTVGARKLEAPVWIVPGQADGVLSLSFGYGRTRAGRVGSGPGFNAYLIRPTSGAWFAKGVELRPTGRRYPLVVTQDHHSMAGRDIVQFGTLDAYNDDPSFLTSHGDKRREESHRPFELETLYPDLKRDLPASQETENAWGMVIDQTACVGCNACVIACQAENNVPIVGKEQVSFGREMHWLRIDRYYVGTLENPDTYFQPMLCQHCEDAPCELVCPVGATVHSSEGLNQMVYNRCVGTRYCSNNCPYKVRRFNFLNYEALHQYDHSPQIALMRNPDVTVRSRGVMEKCSFCVQRIQEAKIEAHKENRPITDRDLQTACQQACPTRAIVFGNVNNRESEVARLKTSPLNYGVLAELNTRPRTTYLARLRNPNPELDAGPQDDAPSLDKRDRKIEDTLQKLGQPPAEGVRS